MPADRDTKFTASDARAIFDGALRPDMTAEQHDKVVLLREFFCNPEFRKAMQSEVARINGVD